MQIDMSRIKELNESELSALIYEVTRAMGMSEAKARRAASNSAGVKAMLLSAKESDLQKLVSSIGEKKAEEILSKRGIAK